MCAMSSPVRALHCTGSRPEHARAPFLPSPIARCKITSLSSHIFFNTMALIVHKYGGTSMGSTERIKNVARRVAKWDDAGHQIVVVPPAMSGETNRLLGLAKEIMAEPDPRELDMIASTGEQVSVALLSMALHAIGKDAVSYA